MIEALAIITTCAFGIVGLAYLNRMRAFRKLMIDYQIVKVMAREASDSSDRQASAIIALHTRLDRIQEQVTPSANATVKRMAAIARGEA